MPKITCQGTGPTADNPRRDHLKGCKQAAFSKRKTWRWGAVVEGKKTIEIFYVNLCPGHLDVWDALQEKRKKEVRLANAGKRLSRASSG